ncbi:MAG: mechanosensitive ion channel family protein [Myxococcota bacterium]|nr:mechanosensitive ion channel family protein [Myxococcota bacterium]
MLFLFILLVSLARAKSDSNCASPRGSVATLIDNLQSSSWSPKLASSCFETEKEAIREELAIQLKQTLDSKGYRIDYDNYSEDPKYVDEKTSLSTVFIDPRLPDIEIVKIGDRWLIPIRAHTPIREAYKKTFSSGVSQFVNQLPPIFREVILFNIQIWQICYLLLLLLFAWILGRVVDRIIIHQISLLAKRFKLTFAADRLSLIRTPLTWMSFGLVLIYGSPNLRFSINLSQALLSFSKILVTLSFIVLLSRLLEGITSMWSSKAAKTESKIDDQLIPLVKRAFQILIWALGIIFLLQNLGVEVTALLAFGSVSGVAIALASQDTVENLFGSFVVFIDQPFQIGDWVVIDGSIEGVVEEVGFRSTRIRAFTNSLISVPNSKITKCTVNNYGRREFRRLKTTLGLRYDTPVEKIEAYLEALRNSLQENPNVKKDAIFIYFNSLSSSSLDILVYTFLDVPDWRAELAEKEAIFLRFVRMAQDLGIGFAFPTQTIELETQGSEPSLPLG